jgi:hypothetical protein
MDTSGDHDEKLVCRDLVFVQEAVQQWHRLSLSPAFEGERLLSRERRAMELLLSIVFGMVGFGVAEEQQKKSDHGGPTSHNSATLVFRLRKDALGKPMVEDGVSDVRTPVRLEYFPIARTWSLSALVGHELCSLQSKVSQLTSLHQQLQCSSAHVELLAFYLECDDFARDIRRRVRLGHTQLVLLRAMEPAAFRHHPPLWKTHSYTTSATAASIFSAESGASHTLREATTQIFMQLANYCEPEQPGTHAFPALLASYPDPRSWGDVEVLDMEEGRSLQFSVTTAKVTCRVNVNGRNVACEELPLHFPELKEDKEWHTDQTMWAARSTLALFVHSSVLGLFRLKVAVRDSSGRVVVFRGRNSSYLDSLPADVQEMLLAFVTDTGKRKHTSTSVLNQLKMP